MQARLDFSTTCDFADFTVKKSVGTEELRKVTDEHRHNTYIKLIPNKLA